VRVTQSPRFAPSATAPRAIGSNSTRCCGQSAAGAEPGAGSTVAAPGAGHANGRDSSAAVAERFLEAVSAALCDDIRLREQYVMIAAAADVAERFRALSAHPHLLPPAVTIDPGRVTEDRLRRAAQRVYERWRSEETRRFVDDLRDRPEGVTSDPREVITAAREGRVDTLIAARHGHLWGRADDDGRGLELHDTRGPDSRDLLDTAMRAAWRHGGRIRIANPQDLSALLQARLRD